MSIDQYCYVTPNSDSPSGWQYTWAIDKQIMDSLNAKLAKEHGTHTIYIMQQGIEYLYNYADPERAQADFDEWRQEPCESIQLKLNGEWQPEGRVELAEEQIKAWQETRAKEEAMEGSHEKQNDFGWLG